MSQLRDGWYAYCGNAPEHNAQDWTKRVLHPDNVQRWVRRWSRALQHGNGFEVERQDRRHDGHAGWFRTRATPFRDICGRLAGWCGNGTDTQKRQERERQHFERLHQEFLAMAAHELKTPITALKGYAQLLQRGRHVEEAVQIIVEQSNHLTRLVDDLLEASRHETGQLKLHLAEIDYAEVVRRSVQHAERLTDHHGIRLALPHEPLRGTGDVDRLEQVLQNLLSNAVKYSPDGGVIRVDAARRNDHLELSVADEGIGIAPEMLPHVFDRFYHMDDVSETCRGLGLGLYITRTFVEAHAGTIRAESKGPGQGSTFTVTLPLAPPRGPTEAGSPAV